VLLAESSGDSDEIHSFLGRTSAPGKHRASAAPSSGFRYDGRPGISNNGWSGISGGGIEYGSDIRALRYEPPADLKIGYAKNDGAFVPSTFMNYDDALALGRQQLASAQECAKNEGAVSLGEIARTYRAVKVPTLRLQARVLQDNFGNLEICNLNGNDCHRP
jgi:hypothetical protein